MIKYSPWCFQWGRVVISGVDTVGYLSCSNSTRIFYTKWCSPIDTSSSASVFPQLSLSLPDFTFFGILLLKTMTSSLPLITNVITQRAPSRLTVMDRRLWNVFLCVTIFGKKRKQANTPMSVPNANTFWIYYRVILSLQRHKTVAIFVYKIIEGFEKVSCWLACIDGSIMSKQTCIWALP